MKDASPENLQQFFAKKTQTNLESLEDWMLAGLVIWQEVNNTQKNWIIKKLSKDPLEMFLKYWKNEDLPKSSILIKTGHFKEISEPEIQLSIMPAGCRGRHQWPNKLMKRGDLRLSIRLPNPSNPYYGERVNWVNYYFCAECSSKYIKSKKRYALIKEWWPRSLKSERVAEEEQIKEQKEKETEKESLPEEKKPE